MKILILLTMIFLHIISDFNLQKDLGLYKQKDWWKENYPDKLYEQDYIAALIIHSFMWTFMMTLPVIVFNIYTGNKFGFLFYFYFVCNICCHGFVDHIKANIKEMNLTTDQVLHLLQIFYTWFLFIV